MKNFIGILSLILTTTTLSFSQNALNFDGNDDLVQTNYQGVLAATNRTFEAWVFVPSTAPASNLCIIDYGVNAVGARNTFAVSSTRALTFVSGGTNANISTPGSTVPLDQWAHVAFVINSGVGFLYVNGVQEGTGSLSSVSTPLGGQNVRIGQRVSGGSIPFQGGIDEVRIWDVARTQAEISANMNIEICSVEADLQLYLRFNEGVAGGTNTGVDTAPDDSGNGYTAPLTNFALTGATSNWITGPVLTPGYSSSSETETACFTYTWTANSMTYTSSGVYSEVLVGANSSGCDSLVTLDLTINSANDLTTNATVCDTYTWSVNGQTYTSSTTVVETLSTSQGCSYDHTLNLTVGLSSSDTMTIDACDAYTWNANGTTYTTSGTYNEMFTNGSGCDSAVTLELTISTVDNGATDNGDLTITATEAGATYQWLDCDNTFAVLSGETGQTYTATANGTYAVEVTANGCTDTSACITIDYVNIETLAAFGEITLAPNPTTSVSTLSFGKQVSNAKISISDASGRELTTFNVKNAKEAELAIESAPGVYFVTVQGGTNERAVLRLIKE